MATCPVLMPKFTVTIPLFVTDQGHKEAFLGLGPALEAIYGLG
jgi:hypothetical protein